ncbi:MAG: NYN domain-containing protein [Eubacteriales bacterium]|nr:NYN domain-containing protein [Eubacteriales bacterium]MDD3881101.1 NYN domain-containing protein [Eubacteriales bacterium]MDD4511483.1 NYN domain-containing protein [Eubacteriales bacterium]
MINNNTSHFALFVDLENCGAKVATLNNILEKVKIRGDILLGKVYGYTDRFSDLKEVLLSNTFTVVPSLRFGAAQKNNADILLVIDALEVAFTNPRIDSFCIVSGDSDYTPLVGRLKSMGKFVLGISRSEAASKIFINACNEFQFLETVSQSRSVPVKTESAQQSEETIDEEQLMKLIENILDERDEQEVFASEVKGTLMRLRPDFNEKNYGCATFGKLLTKLEQKYRTIAITNDNYNMMVSLHSPEEDAKRTQIGKENWKQIFLGKLKQYKDNGFDRINPSILKADIQADYPQFTERIIGFRRFSDVMKQLQKEGLLRVEMDEQKTMLLIIPDKLPEKA